MVSDFAHTQEANGDGFIVVFQIVRSLQKKIRKGSPSDSFQVNYILHTKLSCKKR